MRIIDKSRPGRIIRDRRQTLLGDQPAGGLTEFHLVLTMEELHAAINEAAWAALPEMDGFEVFMGCGDNGRGEFEFLLCHHSEAKGLAP